MAETKGKTTEKPFDAKAAHEELLEQFRLVLENQDEIIEKLNNLDSPGTDYRVFSE